MVAGVGEGSTTGCEARCRWDCGFAADGTADSLPMGLRIRCRWDCGFAAEVGELPDHAGGFSRRAGTLLGCRRPGHSWRRVFPGSRSEDFGPVVESCRLSECCRHAGGELPSACRSFSVWRKVDRDICRNTSIRRYLSIRKAKSLRRVGLIRGPGWSDPWAGLVRPRGPGWSDPWAGLVRPRGPGCGIRASPDRRPGEFRRRMRPEAAALRVGDRHAPGHRGRQWQGAPVPIAYSNMRLHNNAYG